MTLIAQNTAEGGTNGAAVAAGGSGSGNAWDAVVNTSGVITYDNTHVDFGAMAYKVAMLSASCRLSWTATTLGAGTLTELYVAEDLYFTGSPTTSCHFMAGVTNAAAQGWALDIASTGKLFIRNSSNANIYTSTNALPVNTFCRVEVHVVHNGAAGTIQVRIFPSPTATTPLEDSGVLTNNFGADTSRLDFGATTSSTALPPYWFGEPRVGNAAGSWLGPAGPAIVTGTADFTGSGSLATASTAAIPATAALSGTGSLAASSAAAPGSTVALSGTGSLSTATGPAVAAAVSLSGAGTLNSSSLTPVAAWLSSYRPNVAHRGASAEYVEETADAYAKAAAFSSDLALEVSVWPTSDGQWACSHDQNTLRVFGTSVDIPSNPWSALTGLRTTTGNFPMANLVEILNAHAKGRRVIFIDNKAGTNMTALLDLLDTYGGNTRFIIKAFYTAASISAAAFARGYLTWGYYYDADRTNIASTQSRWSILGMDYTASAAAWTEAKAYGKAVLGHIITSSANATTAYAAGADGLMTGKLVGVVPQTGAAADLSGSGTLAAVGGPGASVTVALSGSGSLTTSFTARAGGVAPLSGGGVLAAGASPAVAVAVGLSGGGLLVASAGATGTGSAASLSGSGQLVSGLPTPGVAGSAMMTGTGQLATAAPSGAVSGTAALSGSGALTTAGGPLLPGTAGLSGAGALEAGTAASGATLAALSGSGALITIGSTRLPGAIQLAGVGQMIVVGAPGLLGVSGLTGIGELVAAGGAPPPAGSGNLTVKATLAPRRWRATLQPRRYRATLGAQP